MEPVVGSKSKAILNNATHIVNHDSGVCVRVCVPCVNMGTCMLQHSCGGLRAILDIGVLTFTLYLPESGSHCFLCVHQTRWPTSF